MSFSGIQATVNFYSIQEANLTNELTDIMSSITLASRQMFDVCNETTSKKDEIRGQYDTSDPEYDIEMSKVKDEYELTLAEITAWESELETQKETKETEIQATSSFLDSFKSALKENVQKDMKYAQ